jgi:hypothetical protein
MRLEAVSDVVPNTLNIPAPSLRVFGASVDLNSISQRGVDLAIIALGFEERTRISAQRLLSVVKPKAAILVQYGAGQGEEVKREIEQLKIPSQVVETHEELGRLIGASDGQIVIDCSGMSKPFLFVAVRDALRRRKHVAVVHTVAEQYYPRNEDLESNGILADSGYSDILSRLDNVLMGEAPPYRLIQVHAEPAELERWRGLIASASAKNDRLWHLLDSRTYDATRIFVPPATSARQRVARAAAELAASAAEANVGLVEVETNDVVRALEATEQVYSDLYFKSGGNVEIGLTGSKMHAVAFAAIAAAGRISAAWYVSPQSFDQQRFTIGTGETRVFDIQVR